jgi:hypothetical protein
MKIFLSYRRAESAGHAGRLYDALGARFGRDSVFMDVSDIEPGESFSEVIHAEIRSCDVLIAVIGRDWLTCVGAAGRRLDDPDDLVRAEIAAALTQGIPVIPVLVGGAAPPTPAALPDALKPLAARDAHDISDERWTYDVDRLIEAVARRGGHAAGRTRRRAWLAAGAALAIAGFLGAAAYRQLRPDAMAPDGGVDAAPGAQASLSAASPLRVAGDWNAEVTYPWGATHIERFAFTVEGHEVLGTASFLGTPRAIVQGTLDGDALRFETRTQEVVGDWTAPRDVVHRYRGMIAGDAIEFRMQSAGGSSDVPVEFRASRGR